MQLIDYTYNVLGATDILSNSSGKTHTNYWLRGGELKPTIDVLAWQPSYICKVSPAGRTTGRSFRIEGQVLSSYARHIVGQRQNNW